MAVATRHGIFGVELQNDGMMDPVLLGGVTSITGSSGLDVRAIAADDQVFASFQSLIGGRPSVSFTTMAIAAALDLFPSLGLALVSTTNPGLNLYAQKHDRGGTRASGSSHRKFNVRDGIVVPRTLSVSHQGDATLSYDVVVTFDGTNDPVIVSDSVALPTGLADDERFTLGPVTLGGVAVTGVTSLSIDFGIGVEPIAADSDIYPTYASVSRVAPVVTISGINAEWFKSSIVPLLGRAATHANTTIYLRKRAAGGTYVADGTAEHVQLTGDGLVTLDNLFSGSGAEPMSASLRLPLRFDGTNNPLVVDTTSAIS